MELEEIGVLENNLNDGETNDKTNPNVEDLFLLQAQASSYNKN